MKRTIMEDYDLEHRLNQLWPPEIANCLNFLTTLYFLRGFYLFI
jgi:hypothetical protein